MSDAFFKNVKERCRAKEITITKLENDLHLPRGFVFKTKTHTPSVDRAATIATYLETTVDALLSEVDRE